VAEREWSEGQKIVVHKDGGMTLTMTARSPAEIISWVLSFDEAAELLAPKHLRKAVAEKLRALAARYENA